MATVAHFLPNLSRSRDNFEVDVDEILRSRQAMEVSGLALVAFFHSHPDGSTQPSLRDARLPGISGLASLILATDGRKLLLECYEEVAGKIVPVTVTRSAKTV